MSGRGASTCRRVRPGALQFGPDALDHCAQVQVHTPGTLRAKELQQLYGGLTLTDLSLDERLDVLLHVKWTVKEFDCQLTRDIVALIEREADMLNRQDSTLRRAHTTIDGGRGRAKQHVRVHGPVAHSHAS